MTDTSNVQIKPNIGDGWYSALAGAFAAPGFSRLKDFLVQEKKMHAVFPKGGDIFRAFDLTPIEMVKVVILGQDPYHGPDQAHGLCFSVPVGIPAPPSLQNIFTEMERDLGIPRPTNGDLSSWARQGVLLLNATLTVRAHQAASHQGKGWEEFTDQVIAQLNTTHQGLIFLLWGRSAQQKAALIDGTRHYLLKAPHPSPLSAYRGFIGCGHFSKVNELLLAQGKEPVDWSLP